MSRVGKIVWASLSVNNVMHFIPILYFNLFCFLLAPSSKYFSLDSPPHGSKGYESPTSGNEASSIDPQPVPQSNMVLRKRIRKIKQGMKR